MGLPKVLLEKVKKAIRDPELIWSQVLIFFGQLAIKRVLEDGKVFYEYRGEAYPEYLNCGNAASFIVDKAKQYCIGKGVDIGAGQWPFPGATPIFDEGHQNAYRLDSFADGSLDYVFSSHCLEHLKKWQDALKLWVRKLRSGGILSLYLPHPSMKLWRRGGPWVGLGHKWIPTMEILADFLLNNGMQIISDDPGPDRYWSFHVIARKLPQKA